MELGPGAGLPAHPPATRLPVESSMSSRAAIEVRIRLCLAVFVFGLVVSGLTAFPLVTEVHLLAELAHRLPTPEGLVRWIDIVDEGLRVTNARHPFLAYGTDWLAFAHLAIAVAFWGPWRDPVRNVWVIEFGMIACVLVIPLALVCGHIRGIPWFWRLIDCSFGVLGILPLWISRRLIGRLEAEGEGLR